MVFHMVVPVICPIRKNAYPGYIHVCTHVETAGINVFLGECKVGEFSNISKSVKTWQIDLHKDLYLRP